MSLTSVSSEPDDKLNRNKEIIVVSPLNYRMQSILFSFLFSTETEQYVSALVFNWIMMKRVITAYSVAYVINVGVSLSRNKFTK